MYMYILIIRPPASPLPPLSRNRRVVRSIYLSICPPIYVSINKHVHYVYIYYIPIYTCMYTCIPARRPPASPSPPSSRNRRMFIFYLSIYPHMNIWMY